jgi:hypothetical protein
LEAKFAIRSDGLQGLVSPDQTNWLQTSNFSYKVTGKFRYDAVAGQTSKDRVWSFATAANDNSN